MRALPGRETRTAALPTSSGEGTPEELRRRIMLAMGELVAKRGYNAVTVELVLNRSKVSSKTFYRYFESKEACFLLFFDTVMADVAERVEAAERPDASWPEQVIGAVRALFDFVVEEPIVARACIVEAPTVGPAIVERYDRATRGISPLLGKGREFGEDAADLPATLEDTLAAGILWSAYQRLLVSEVDRIEQLLPESVEFLLRPYLGSAEAERWAKWSRESTSAGG